MNADEELREEELRGINVLCVDDDPAVGRFLERTLRCEGMSVGVVASGAEFLRNVEAECPHVGVVDLHLPDISGVEILREAHRRWPELPLVVLSGSGSIQGVVDAMKSGAADYLTKPFKAHRLKVSLRNVLRVGRQGREIARLRSDLCEAYALEHVIGASSGMNRVRDLIQRAARTSSTVLVMGESGVGKELVARALHFAGPRAAGPWVDVNCAALTESLLESELFGHEQGAFTGAGARRRGKFEQADGGSLFLDEIGDMPPATQSKILRILQDRVFQRVGGEETIRVDVRVVCATNQDLEFAVHEGKFRKDLLYRINTLIIEVPPLRERVADISSLAAHFLARAVRREKTSVTGISASALEVLERHSWPGNVRELEHAIDRAVVVCDGEELRPEHLPPAVLAVGEKVRPDGLVGAVERLEGRMIEDALARSGGILAHAARDLGITERMISYKMHTLGLTRTRGLRFGRT